MSATAKSSFKLVNAPLELSDRIVIKNRIYFAPMGIDMADGDGGFSCEMGEFYQGIIDGGCGMVVLGNASIHPSTQLHGRGLCLHNENHAKTLASIIKYGVAKQCPVVIQLQHYGAQGSTARTGLPVISPSGRACSRMTKNDPQYRVRQMDESDIVVVKQQFLDAAIRAQGAGATMIQLQAANGYLLSSFLSPLTNQRTDLYGGSPLRRARLLLEVVESIGTYCPGLGVLVRLGIDDCMERDGQEPRLLHEVIVALELAGVKAISCSMAIGETFHQLLGRSDQARLKLLNGVREIRDVSNIPIGFSGFVASLEEAELHLSDGISDFVGMTRALFADNDLVRKSLDGNSNAVQKCLFDGNCFRDKGNPDLDRVYCCVNKKYLRPIYVQYR